MTDRTIPIAGMTCAACEVTVAEAALALPSVKSAKASARTGLLRVTGDLSDADLAVALEGTPYRLGNRPWWTRERSVWRDAAIGVGVVLVLAVIVMALGLDERVQQATQSAGTGSLLLVAGLGVAASVSTCMALVGGLVLALSASSASTAPARTRMRPHLAFNLGRVLGFGVLGAVIGGAGQALAISGVALAVLMLIVALVMALLGLRLTQVSPRIAGWQASLPSSWGRWARTQPADASAQSASARDLRAMGLGAATFFLPCGFTQAVQVLALGSGSAVSGAAIMAVFAIATAPGLLAAGAAATFARREGTARALRFAGVVVLGFALVTGAGAVTSLAPGLFTQDVVATERTPNVSDSDGFQLAATSIVGDGYSPANTVVYVGEPVRWSLAPEVTSCAGLLDLKSLGLGSIEVLFDDAVVEFTLDKPGTYSFACSMGMYSGSFTAIERPAAT